MYKILLADDEGIVTDTLKFIIDKEFNENNPEGPQCEIEIAHTGRAVIELTETFRPDIAFMDIQMPGINGIDAMKEIRKQNENMILIVLSAYDKFDYAKEALNLGVKEYLNKPVDRQKIIDALRDSMGKIDSMRKNRERELLIREKMETVVPVIENGLIYNLLLQEYFEEDIINYKNLLEITEERCFMGVLVFGDSREGNHMTNAVGSSIRLHKYYNDVRDLVRGYFRCFVGAVTGNKIPVMFPTNEEELSYNDRVTMIDRARELCRKIKEKTGIDVRFGLGRSVLPMEAMDSYNDALRALIQTNGSVAHIDDVPVGGNFEDNYPTETEKEIEEATEKGDEDAQQKAALAFFDWMAGTYEADLSDIQLKTLEIVLRCETIGYHGSSETYRFQSRSDYLPTILSIGADIDRLRNWYLEKLRDAVHTVSEASEKRAITTVGRAKEYILLNYGKDISLDDVSREVDISPYYFSKVFKEETGENFIEYLTNIRIERAKELLRDPNAIGLSMKEISGECGYPDPNYFSRIFKKTVGVTPTEFREKK
ncbi:MAG: response regulator [Lachnospiraceae bacterium]|nr:response regulator [Lachnospiraceae bacterium]